MKTRRNVTNVSDPLEAVEPLARLIESHLAHWRICRQWPCAECDLIEMILGLAGLFLRLEPTKAGNTIFSEQLGDVQPLGKTPNGSRSRPTNAALHAKLDILARSNSRWLSFITEAITFAYNNPDPPNKENASELLPMRWVH